MAVRVPKDYDFCGYATRNNVLCTDGRTIRKNAFKHQDGKTVPLVWNHLHNDMNNVIGHAILENRDDGVYCYGYLNDTDQAEVARKQLRHKDIRSLSIYANHLKQKAGDVIHGMIREVSLVLAGANDGAYIDWVLEHGDEGGDDAAIIYPFIEKGFLYHGDDDYDDEDEDFDDEDEDDEDFDDEDEDLDEDDDSDEKTIGDVLDTLDEEQMEAVGALIDAIDGNENAEEEFMEHSDGNIGEVLDTLDDDQMDAVFALIGAMGDDQDDDDEYDDDEYDSDEYDDDDFDDDDYDDDDDYYEEDDDMKHNVFDGDTYRGDYLSHSDMEAIFDDAKRNGSLKEAFLAHCEAMQLDADELMHDDVAQNYGIDHIEALFPEYKNLNTPPEWIKRDVTWVPKVLNGAHHTPFSRIKSMFANLTEDEARAKGYIKGHMKKEQVFSLLKRTTDPCTVYKKQKLDRDDQIDITDFDVVQWIKSEMRGQLDEELARAILVGDGRLTSDEDHIPEDHIRPIWKDADLFAIKVTITMKAGATDDDKAKALIRATIKARKYYKGSGSPSMFTTEDVLSDMLLLEDGIGHSLYDSESALATKCRVSSIVPVEIMEGLTDETQGDLAAIVVNMSDYNVGADKGGAVAMFEDFDIDYNQNKYLIETRCSGALVKPYSALIFSFKQGEGENTVISFSGDGMDEFTIKDEESNG
ncbi:MAG: HK97 family phage prohead protease [Clostridiales bacterium]|nr:HK97 family phage prohead protease [Clostridiales bacterium]